MHFASLLVAVVAASTGVDAFALPKALSLFGREASGGGGSGGSGKGGSSGTSATCPAIWADVGTALRNLFYDNSTGLCNGNARAAIRAAFHDCGTWNTAQALTGGCDGSLIIANESWTRSENDGLQDISTLYMELRANFSNEIGMADLLQFGAAAAIKTCPSGPTVTTYVGRTDWTTLDAPNAMGMLPDVNSNSTVLINLFADKGFTAEDLVVLVGAHSTSTQQFVDPAEAGLSQDGTPGIWDVQFYTDTQDPPVGVYRFPSDIALLNDPVTGPIFTGFQGTQHQTTWDAKFALVMTQLSLLGAPGGTSTGLADCTTSLPISSSTTGIVTTSGGQGQGKRDSFSFSKPRFNAHPIARDTYKNFHKW